MKNIHILPTDKPSRLFIDENILILDNEYLPNIPSDGQNQHIYITSDEKIKEGDCMIRDNEQPIKVTKDFFWDFGVRYYKIILTTDEDLIKDGVQAIDDEFLEWFIKNPNCEEVDINIDFGVGLDISINFYKIIIPKEESKQRLEKYSERFDNKDNEIVEGIFNPETWGKRLVDDVPKQETVFENAKLILRKHILKNKEQVIKDLDEMRKLSNEQEILEESGEYQQELFNYLHDLGVTALQSEMQEIERIVLAMQDKNKYSEEEVLPLLEMLQKCKEYFLLKTDLKSEERADAIGQVLEKFKNK